MADSFSFKLFDSHCHLQDDRFASSVPDVLSRARSAGIGAMLCCGSSKEDWERVFKLSIDNPDILPAFGLHPWYVGKRTENWLNILEEYLTKTPGSSIGEIGLDHMLDQSTFADQELVFVEQLQLAQKLNRPCSIHCRKSFGRMVELLHEQRGVSCGGVLHSYSGPPDLVQEFEKLGLNISFSGSVTYSNSKRARNAVRMVSNDTLLIETDSPDIKPFGWGSEFNEPASLLSIAQTLAELRETTVENIARITWENGVRLFGRPR
jgi:TatD DNase family protein